MRIIAANIMMQPINSFVLIVSFKSIAPAMAAKTASRLIIMDAAVGLVYF